MSDHKVLFLGHNASRSGAPLILLELIKWLAKNSQIKMETYLDGGGAIESEYHAAVLTYCPHEFQGIFGKLFRKLRTAEWEERRFVSRYPASRYPVVYANTIATCRIANRLAGPNRFIIHHIHEMTYATQCYHLTDALREAVPTTDLYIAVSQAVRKFLMDVIFVPEEKILVVHEFPVAGGSVGGKINDEKMATNKVRQILGIPEESFVIGMCGTPEWRKGTDIFVRLVEKVRAIPEGAKCHFIWLGGEKEAYREAQFDVDKSGLRDFCHFIPAVGDPDAYFRAFDLFALTSREDPFPLVMLEAAARGLPIVCFADSGGATELVEDDAGMIVPYLDVEAMAQACVELMVDDEKRRRFGAQAKAKVESRYLLEHQGPKILSVIESAFKSVSAAKSTNTAV